MIKRIIPVDMTRASMAVVVAGAGEHILCLAKQEHGRIITEPFMIFDDIVESQEWRIRMSHALANAGGGGGDVNKVLGKGETPQTESRYSMESYVRPEVTGIRKLIANFLRPENK